MVGRTASEIRLLVVAGLSLALFGTAQAVDENYLRLMVTDCQDQPLDNAFVRVVLHHSGGGTLRQNSYTEDGYIEFLFEGLSTGDVADITVTPSGQGEDQDHSYTYVWQENGDDPEVWDLGSNVTQCPDKWWDQDEQVIQCVYYTGN